MKIGYMCKTDYEWHLENDAEGVPVYTSEKALRRARKCVDECGMVKVTVEKLEKM